ncbi:hypothetical protein PVL29_013837 [Vitis rotundifolia]|uniref:Uncharacterized protein n=1 Tax=Vitis rotundifolia TaxID=103349 RepID=A0AA39DPU9_VITRO|nr:hypothetical protein PVL29_013837 [Vitis rotundifolia]
MGSLVTPVSSITKKKRNQAKMTPGSGEALLRGQVKTLLQKVEKGTELLRLSLEDHPFLHVQGLINGPTLLAPTPTNTPQVLNLTVEQSINNSSMTLVMPSPMGQELKISKKENIELETSPVTHPLLLDFSEKSEIAESSECKEKTPHEDNDASVWSIRRQSKKKKKIIMKKSTEEEKYENDGGIVDEPCEGMSKISMNENRIHKFRGKHTQFVYNSDDNLVEEEEEEGLPGILHLKGLPKPKGNHLHFSMEE